MTEKLDNTKLLKIDQEEILGDTRSALGMLMVSGMVDFSTHVLTEYYDDPDMLGSYILASRPGSDSTERIALCYETPYRAGGEFRVALLQSSGGWKNPDWKVAYTLSTHQQLSSALFQFLLPDETLEMQIANAKICASVWAEREKNAVEFRDTRGG